VTGNEAVVDLESHRSFPRLRTVCVGTLQGTGVIDAGALFVIHDVGPRQDGNTEIVRVDLTTYTVQSTPLAGVDWIFPGLGDIWAVTVSTNTSLVKLSPSSLRVLHRFAYSDDGVPFDGRLWFIDNYSLKTWNPANGRVSLVRLPWLPTGLSPASLTPSNGELFILASSQKSPENAIATYNPMSGAHRVVREPQLPGGGRLLSVTGRVLWVEPPGGMQGYVTAYSARTLKPLANGFGGGGVGGSWIAVPDEGDLWFQSVGEPLECVSGKTGRTWIAGSTT
jgi:hypothetical protein